MNCPAKGNTRVCLRPVCECFEEWGESEGRDEMDIARDWMIEQDEAEKDEK